MNHVLSRLLLSLATAGLILGLVACSEQAPHQRRMQTVKLLPDTPPPPPPPKPEEKRPEPPKQEKQETTAPKPEQDPSTALKSDEAAGDGPGNGLVSGAVTRDYAEQKPPEKPQLGGTGNDAATRLAATSFANATARALNDFLARERELKRSDFRAQVNVWLSPTGTLERAELIGSTGNGELDRALTNALTRFPGSQAPLPQSLPQPLRLQVTNRMLG